MVDCGESELRQIITGISQFYTPEDLINQKIIEVDERDPAAGGPEFGVFHLFPKAHAAAVVQGAAQRFVITGKAGLQ